VSIRRGKSKGGKEGGREREAGGRCLPTSGEAKMRLTYAATSSTCVGVAPSPSWVGRATLPASGPA